MMADSYSQLHKLHSELEKCLSMMENQGEYNHGHFHENVMPYVEIFDEKQYKSQDIKSTIDLFERLKKQLYENATHYAGDIDQVIAKLSKKVDHNEANNEEIERRSKRGRDLNNRNKDSAYCSADSRLFTEAGYLVTNTSDDRKDSNGK